MISFVSCSKAALLFLFLFLRFHATYGRLFVLRSDDTPANTVVQQSIIHNLLVNQTLPNFDELNLLSQPSNSP